MEKEIETPKERNVFFEHKNIVISVLVLLFFFVVLYFLFTGDVKNNNDTSINNKKNVISEKRITEYNNNYYAITFKNDPKGIQNSFLSDLKNGVNNMYTKSDAYFIMHRFFDNGGNIYEIYDYVNAHPELSFLQKEAENLSPVVFEKIKNKDPSITLASDESYYAFLAYLEVLINHGYTDIAAVSTLANQYAKLAYFATEDTKELSKKDGEERIKYVNRNIKITAHFLSVAHKDISMILDGKITSRHIPSRDILVGLNQTASALRYLEALGFSTSSVEAKSYFFTKGIDISKTKSHKEIFAFAMEYSSKNVPELFLFTSLLNASTLAILEKSTSEEIKLALYPILDFDTKKVGSNYYLGIIGKIIDTRFEKKAILPVDAPSDIYSKKNTLRLAKKVPEFKKWLMYNGWEESDFK